MLICSTLHISNNFSKLLYKTKAVTDPYNTYTSGKLLYCENCIRIAKVITDPMIAIILAYCIKLNCMKTTLAISDPYDPYTFVKLLYKTVLE